VHTIIHGDKYIILEKKLSNKYISLERKKFVKCLSRVEMISDPFSALLGQQDDEEESFTFHMKAVELFIYGDQKCP
jgi:hypothetical protein